MLNNTARWMIMLLLGLVGGTFACQADPDPAPAPAPQKVEFLLKDEEKRLERLGNPGGIVISDEEEDIAVPRPDAENSVTSMMERTRQKQIIDTNPEETAQMYSEWSGVPVEEILLLNDNQPPAFGKPYALSMTATEFTEFMKRREQYWTERCNKFTEPFHVQLVDYVIKRGDTLTAVSRKHDIPLWLLVRYNRANDPHGIQPGSTLTVPLLKERKEVEEEGKAKARALMPEEKTGNYSIIVQSGEKVSLYAKWASISVEDIQRANPDVNINRIRVGQRLYLPCGSDQFLAFQKSREAYGKK